MFRLFKRQSTLPTPEELTTTRFEDLKALKEAVDAVIEERVELARNTFAEQIAQYGLTLDDIRVAARKKRVVAIKYRDPDNPDNTWTGMGKPKKWLQAYLDEGRSLEEFAAEPA